jgi:hypothetical protein
MKNPSSLKLSKDITFPAPATPQLCEPPDGLSFRQSVSRPPSAFQRSHDITDIVIGVLYGAVGHIGALCNVKLHALAR